MDRRRFGAQSAQPSALPTKPSCKTKEETLCTEESSAVGRSERSIWKHCRESRKTGSRGTHPGPIFTQEMMEPAESRS